MTKKSILIKTLNKLITSKLKISVLNPCNQLWDKMDLSQNGRYCNLCEKEVIDFSAMNITELETWFSSSKEKVCGQFHPSQLNADKLSSKNSWKIASTKILIASCLTLVTGLKANATLKNDEKIAYYQQKNGTAQIEIQNLEVLRIDSVIFIKGKITSSNDKLPLVGIKIQHKGSEKNVFSDRKGNFLLEIPATTNQKIILIFSHLEFEPKEIEVNDNQINPVKIVAYKMESHRLILGGAVAFVTRLPWYKRVWNYVKRQF
jgi:hypothetical protein